MTVQKVTRKRFSESNLLLEAHLAELGLLFIREYAFCEGRKWRFDYLIAKDQLATANVAVEIEGGVGYFKNPKGRVIRGGRHSREDGYRSDLEKYRMASALGYRLYRFSTREVLDGTAKAFLEKWA
jgi:hypothetical protein